MDIPLPVQADILLIIAAVGVLVACGLSAFLVVRNIAKMRKLDAYLADHLPSTSQTGEQIKKDSSNYLDLREYSNDDVRASLDRLVKKGLARRDVSGSDFINATYRKI